MGTIGGVVLDKIGRVDPDLPENTSQPEESVAQVDDVTYTECVSEEQSTIIRSQCAATLEDEADDPGTDTDCEIIYQRVRGSKSSEGESVPMEIGGVHGNHTNCEAVHQRVEHLRGTDQRYNATDSICVKRKSDPVEISSSDNEASTSGRSTPEDMDIEDEITRTRSPELDNIEVHIRQEIEDKNLEKAMHMITEMCVRLEKSYKSEEDKKYLDYAFYVLTAADLYREVSSHAMAVKTFYKGLLHLDNDQMSLQQHIMISSKFWNDLFQSGTPLQAISNIACEVQMLVEAQLQRSDRSSYNVPLCIYSDLMLTFKNILLHYPDCPGSRDGKLKATLGWLKCLIAAGLAFQVKPCCKIFLKEYPENASLLEIWSLALKDTGELNLALKKAEEACLHVRNPKQKEALEQLQTDLKQEIEGQICVVKESSKLVDTKWLEGTNINEPLRNTSRKEEIKENHVKKVRRRPKPRIQNVQQYFDLRSWSDVKQDTAGATFVSADRKRRKKRRRHNTAGSEISTTGSNKDILNDIDNESEYASRLQEVDDYAIESDEELCVSESYRASIFDTETNELAESDYSDEQSVGIPESMFEQSVQEIASEEIYEGIKEREQDLLLKGAALSARFVDRCFFRDRKNYYSDNLPIEELQTLLEREPKRFKKCTLHLESAHKSVCTLLQPESTLKEIEISGRSKCGKNFTEDEVVVEVLNQDCKTTIIPRFNKMPQTNEELKTYGKVVGRLRRKRFAEIDHPVLVCEMDELEYNLMRPLDKTVPKMHVFDKHCENKFQVEIYEYDSCVGELKFKEVVNINPAQKHSFVFLVVYIRWDAIYPLGAVIKVMRSDGRLNSGLKILELQYQVPTLYKAETVQSVESMMCRMPEEPVQSLFDNRENLTDVLSPFTIDPPNSKVLDDALSVRTLSEGDIEVGVHIADVTSYVRKGDHIDEEAKDRATSFYPGQGRNPYHMIPEPLSQNLCSLLPNKKRLALSIFFRFKSNGECKDPFYNIKKTVVKSKRKFTYKEVQEIIVGSENEHNPFCEDIRTLYRIAKARRQRRLGDSMHSLPVEIDLSAEGSDDSIFDTLEAHYLVEEFMILSNTTVASIICSKFRDCALLRCQDAPSAEKVQQWLKEYPRIVDIVMRLQNIKPTPQRQLRITNAPKARYRVVIEMQKLIWSCLEQSVKDGNFRDAWRIIGSDEFHPEQALAWHDWIQFQEHAEYRCLGSISNRKERFHFTLGISPYTHFTSPIRRYADMVNHRFIHAFLENDASPYLQAEIEDICFHINEVSQRAKRYGNQCKAMQYAHLLKESPLMFRSFIEAVSDKSIQLYIPGMRLLSKSSREVALNLLDVSSKPKIVKDSDDDRPFDILTLTWQKRLYSHKGYAPSTRGLKEIRFDPHQEAIFQQYKRWTDILKAMINGNKSSLGSIFSPSADYQEGDQLRSYVPACTSTVIDVSSEVRQGVITRHFCEFSMSFSHAQILSVQMSAEPQKGILVPYPQIAVLTNNVKLCLQHPADPVKHLAKYATKKAHGQNYRSLSEYLEIWLPLLRMESATMAAKDDSITVNDLPVKLHERDGTFSLTMDFCEERNIDFSSMSMNYILHGNENDAPTEETKYVPSSDFVCIKCPYAIDTGSFNAMKGYGETRIWLAHGQVDKIKKLKKQGRIEVHFLLHPQTPKIPCQLLNSEKKPKCSMEIILKPETNRRTEAALLCLDKASALATAVALGKKIPSLDKDHLRLARRIETEVDVCGLARNNSKQQEAIQRALTRRFTLIQGPPGTGKTYTGIKLLYLYTKLNRLWHQEGNPFKQVVFCGPSNKAVDLVAKWTKRKLGELAPRMVRMYGSSLECMDFPVPGKLYSAKSRKAGNKPDEELQDIALHHLIRQAGKPYAEEIRNYDKYFMTFCDGLPISDPDQAKEYKEKIQDFRALLSKAEREELQHYDVIFCTTAITTNPKFIYGTEGRIFQCIMDESGMCTEPESIATIITTRAEQIVLIGDHKQLRPVVLCQHASNLGLEKSLFERYAEKAIFLSTQYRMNPRICDFVSSQFYNDRLETAPSSAWQVNTPLQLWKYKEVPHIFCHVEGEEEYLTVATEEGNEQSCSNKAEVDKVLAVFGRMVKKESVDPKYINIISQYNAQCHAIKEALSAGGYKVYNVRTVVSSQGGEWDYVIFSSVRSLPDYKIEPRPTLGWCKQNLGFITDEHQVNVALSRARKGLVIIGNKNLLKCDRVWEKLLDHYGKRGCVVDAKDFPPYIRKNKKGKARASRQTSEDFYQGMDLE